MGTQRGGAKKRSNYLPKYKKKKKNTTNSLLEKYWNLVNSTPSPNSNAVHFLKVHNQVNGHNEKKEDSLLAPATLPSAILLPSADTNFSFHPKLMCVKQFTTSCKELTHWKRP